MTRAIVIAVLALAPLPATASAHATLQATTPERGARLDAAPETVTLRFNEPVEAEFGAVRVFDSSGREVQVGNPIGRGREVSVRLRDGFGADGYTVTYRVISADAHPVSGGFVFVVGDATAPSTTVDELLGDDRAGPVTGTAFGVVRAVQFGSIALGLGALIFMLVAAELTPRLRRLVRIAAVGGVGSALLALVLQGAVAGGTSFWDALRPDVVRDVLDTRFGLVWGLGAVAWAVTLLWPPAAAVLALLPALGGHASVQSPVAVLLPANVVHVVAMSAWLGGIAVLVTTPRLTAPVIRRFSTLAGVAIAVLLASGVVQGVVEVRTVPHLLDTAFGRAVLVKAGLLAAIVVLGARNRRRLRGSLLPVRAVLRTELALGAAALVATGALAGYAPSIAESSGPYSTDAAIGPARLELTVDPARPGPNQIHVYLFDRRTGAQYDATKELTATAELPDKRIGPIELAPVTAGPGHYVVTGASLGVAGDWTLTVVARVSAFDEYRARVEVPIR